MSKNNSVDFNTDIAATVQGFRQRIDSVRQNLGKRKTPSLFLMSEVEDDKVLLLPGQDKAMPTLSRACWDLDSGIVCIAARPNIGKSTFVTNVITNSLRLNPNLMWIDFTFDDDLRKRYQQYVCSLSGLTYQQVTTDMQLSEYQINKRKAADDLIDTWINDSRLVVFESDLFMEKAGHLFSYSMRNPTNMIAKIESYRKAFPERDIGVFVDAWNNIDFNQGEGVSETSKAESILGRFKAFCQSNRIRLFMSTHLIKSANPEPTLEDIKGTASLGYDAQFTVILRNDMREERKDPIQIRLEDGSMADILWMDIKKNKVSPWTTGTLTYIIDPWRCQLYPVSYADNKDLIFKRDLRAAKELEARKKKRNGFSG